MDEESFQCTLNPGGREVIVGFAEDRAGIRWGIFRMTGQGKIGPDGREGYRVDLLLQFDGTAIPIVADVRGSSAVFFSVVKDWPQLPPGALGSWDGRIY